MEIIVAKPRGFCAGVERAIKCVEQALIRHFRGDRNANEFPKQTNHHT